MPRPIILTEKMKQKLIDDFNAVLDKIKMPEGELCYRRSYNYKDGKAVVRLTLEAYRKILALVLDFSDEIGWHGTASQVKSNEFIIEDIFVYPQEVTGSTVDTDQNKYTEWLYSLDDETFSKIRMQGHSHAHMGVSPSGTDDKHRKKILDQLESDMFYIFMIWNKSLAVHTIVYNMSKNILYEDDDIDVIIDGDEKTADFMADAREKVQKKVHGSKRNKTDKTEEQLSLCNEFESPYHGMYDYWNDGGAKWKH